MGKAPGKKLLYSVLALAGAGLLIDRGLLGGGASSAEASPGALLALAGQLAGGMPVDPNAGAAAGTQPSLAALLSGLSAAQNGALPGSDPLRMPNLNIGAPAVETSAATSHAIDRIRVSSTVVWGGGGAAKINGRLMRPGDTADGITLLHVEQDRVRIRVDGEEREMPVQRDL